MDKKFSLGKFILTLIIISLVSFFGAYLVNNRVYSVYTDTTGIYERYIYQTIDESMSREGYYNHKLFNYAVKSYKLKYYDNKGIEINDPTRISNKRKADELKAKGLNPEDYIADYVKDDLKGEYKTFYLTNDNTLENEFDPTELRFKNQDLIITGNVKDNRVNILTVTESDRLKNSEFKNFTNTFIQTTKEQLSGINSKYEINNLKFAYYANLDDQVFKDIKSDEFSDRFEWMVLFSVLATMAITAICFGLIKLKSIDLSPRVKDIFSIPIEIVAVLVFLFLFFASSILSTSQYYALLELFLLLLVVGNIIVALTVSYLVVNFKSIFVDDVENYLTTNSLIVRGFKKTFNVYNDTFNSEFDEDDIFKAKKDFTIKYLLILLALLFVFTVVLNVKILALLIVILGILFYIISMKLLNEITRINYESSKIVKGDYKNKIEKNGNIFDRIIDNFNNISSNLDDAVSDALKSERLKTELITNVSHDLKTPLTSIINYSDLINKGDITDEEKNEYAKIIHDKSLKLKNLIEDLFEVSKATSNNIELHKEELDFKALVEQSIGEWEDKINENGIEIITNLPGDKVILNIDGQKFSRVLDNLFSNIYKYALENSRVYVDLDNGENVKLTIKNISKYQLEVSVDELVERFTRGEKSRTTAGSGLGLSIASSFVEAHGAKFDIQVDGDLFKTIIEF